MVAVSLLRCRIPRAHAPVEDGREADGPVAVVADQAAVGAARVATLIGRRSRFGGDASAVN